MAGHLTAAAWRGYYAARRCDGYGSHAYCNPRDHTEPALYNHAVRCRAEVGGVECLTGGAPTADGNDALEGRALVRRPATEQEDCRC